MLVSPLLRAAGALLVLVLVAACARDSDADNIAASMGFDPSGPIPTLPECEDEAPEPFDGDAPGIVLPDGAVLTSITEIGPVTQASAEVRLTPVGVREHYEARDDVDLHASEDEVFEAEVLLGQGDKTVHVTAMALCQDGSAVDLYIAPAGELHQAPDLAGPGHTSTPRKGDPIDLDEN